MVWLTDILNVRVKDSVVIIRYIAKTKILLTYYTCSKQRKTLNNRNESKTHKTIVQGSKIQLKAKVFMVI